MKASAEKINGNNVASPVTSNGNKRSFFQPKRNINEPGDIYEQQADRVADNIINTNSFFKPAKASVNTIQRDEAKPEDKKPAEATPPKEEATVGFIDPDSLKKAIVDIFGKLPERYQTAYNKYKETHETFIFDLSESRKLASNEIMAMWNLYHAILYKSLSPYKDIGFSDSLKQAESLSGVSDTYIYLASLALHKDLKKFISDEVPDIVVKNLGFILLTGLLLQGGIASIQYATNSDINFVSIINPFTTSFTEKPKGLDRPFTLDNIPDARWKYPFLNPLPGPDANYSGNNPDNKAPSLNINLGLNFASAFSLYPKTETEKSKYQGLELYPFFNYSKLYGQGGGAEPDKSEKIFAGIFVGNKGFYTLLEGGAIKGPLGLVEGYGRGGFTLKNFGALKLLQIDAEADYRTATDSLRTRINGAAQINIVDNETWQFALGGSIGALFPDTSKPGAVDFGGSLQLYNKQYSDDRKDVYKTGVDLGVTNRLQDPFDSNSPNLFSVKGGVNIADYLKVGLQYDKISGGGPLSTFPVLPGGTQLPGNNFTFFIATDFSRFLFRDSDKK